MPSNETHFKPGNPGRPKGSRNKLSESFLTALANDFDKHGVQAIETMRVNDPSGYVKTIANLLPKDIHITEKRLIEMTDAEILAQLSGVLQIRKLDDADKSVAH